MTGATRRVRTVRLRAASRSLVRRGAVLLEDALATASLPWADGGRLLLIRRLDVGTIRADRSAASLALGFERSLRRLRSSAVLACRPGAEERDAVFFREPAEAVVELARRLAAGGDVSAWFWRPAVPTWDPGQPAAAGLRTLLRAAHEGEGGVAVAASLVAALASDGRLAALVGGLEPREGVTLLRTFPGSPAPPGRQAGRPGRRAPLPPCLAPAAAWVGRWGAADPRALWLVASLLVADSPDRLGDRGLLADAGEAARELERLASPAPVDEGPGGRGEDEDRYPGRAAVRQAPAPSTPTERGLRLADDEPTAEGPGAAANRTAASTETSATRQPDVGPAFGPLRPAGGDDEAELPVWRDVPERTEVGGLLFLVPVLERLGIERFLEAHPTLRESHLPLRLLTALSRRLGAGRGEPLSGALRPPRESSRPRRVDFAVPETWRRGIAGRGPARLFRHRDVWTLTDRGGRLVVGRWRGAAPAGSRWLVEPLAIEPCPERWRAGDLDVLLDAWITAVRRWCRRAAGIGLHDLIRRPAGVSRSKTHLDLFFDHRRAEVRVRKAGLDLDPGWVAWLGKVVRFHYVHEELP